MVVMSELLTLALFRACRDGNTLSVRTLLQQGALCCSESIDLLNLAVELIVLLLEYGHRIPLLYYQTNKDKLTVYIEHDFSLISMRFCFSPSLQQQQMLYRFLRDQGDYSSVHTRHFISWLTTSREARHCNDLEISQLREAVTCMVTEDDASNAAMTIMKSLRRDWFLSFLHHFDLTVNSKFTFTRPDNRIEHESLICQSLVCGSFDEFLLRFLVLDCHADINACDILNRYTPLMFACSLNCKHLPIKAVICLIDLGADVRAVNCFEETALDHATYAAEKERGFIY